MAEGVEVAQVGVRGVRGEVRAAQQPAAGGEGREADHARVDHGDVHARTREARGEAGTAAHDVHGGQRALRALVGRVHGLGAARGRGVLARRDRVGRLGLEGGEVARVGGLALRGDGELGGQAHRGVPGHEGDRAGALEPAQRTGGDAGREPAHDGEPALDGAAEPEDGALGGAGLAGLGADDHEGPRGGRVCRPGGGEGKHERDDEKRTHGRSEHAPVSAAFRAALAVRAPTSVR